MIDLGKDRHHLTERQRKHQDSFVKKNPSKSHMANLRNAALNQQSNMTFTTMNMGEKKSSNQDDLNDQNYMQGELSIAQILPEQNLAVNLNNAHTYVQFGSRPQAEASPS